MEDRPVVLYADDDHTALRLMDEISIDDGRFTVVGVTSGEDAIRHVTVFPKKYSLIILDVNLGVGMTGGVIKEKIEKICPQLKIVFLSNYNLSMSEQNPDYWFKGDLTNQELADKIVEELTQNMLVEC
jgi:CheY-like chemotaxis protein